MIDGLTQALDVQRAPLMQVALARVLLASGVDASVGAVRRMATSQSTDPRVRDDLNAALSDRPEPAAGRGI